MGKPCYFCGGREVDKVGRCPNCGGVQPESGDLSTQDASAIAKGHKTSQSDRERQARIRSQQWREAGQIPGREPKARASVKRPGRKWAATGLIVSGVMFWSPFIVLALTLFVSALAKPWGIDVSGLWALIDWNTGLVGHVLMTVLVLSIPLGMLCAAFGGFDDAQWSGKE